MINKYYINFCKDYDCGQTLKYKEGILSVYFLKSKIPIDTKKGIA